MVQITGWGRGTWSSGPWGEPLPVELTGLSATGQVDSVSVLTVNNILVTGLAATGGVGTVLVNAAASTSTTGVSGAGAVGNVVVAANADVSVTGLSATGGVGTVTVTGIANVTPTGVSGTGEVGDAVAAASADVSVTGLEATGSVGSVSVVAKADVSPTGVAGTGQVGSASVTADANIPTTGLAATGSVGSVSIVAEANVSPTGLAATGGVGSVLVVAESNVSVTGLAATASVGSVTVDLQLDVPVTGVAATGEVGTAAIVGGATVEVTGVSADALTPSGGSAFTADGNAQLSTAQAKFGSASLLLDGTDDFVTSDDNIDLSSGDFTVDMWIRPTSVTGYKGLWQSGSSSLLRAYLIGDKVRLSVGPSTIIFTSTTGVVANDWTMISIERDGNNHRLYINGTLEETGSSANRPDNGVFSVGKNDFGDFNGYIDELRLSSVARYEGTSFTEPSANYAVDGSTTALLHFDGTNGSTDIVNETEGGVTVLLGINVSVTGVQAQGEPYPVTITAGADVTPTGVAASGLITPPLVWGTIVPNQNPSYTPTQPTQTPAFTETTPAQTPSWSAETVTQTPTWTEETPTPPDPNWKNAA